MYAIMPQFINCRNQYHKKHDMNPNCRKSEPCFWDTLHGDNFMEFVQLEFKTQDGETKVFELLGRDPWRDETLSMCKVITYTTTQGHGRLCSDAMLLKERNADNVIGSNTPIQMFVFF